MEDELKDIFKDQIREVIVDFSNGANKVEFMGVSIEADWSSFGAIVSGKRYESIEDALKAIIDDTFIRTCKDTRDYLSCYD